jgi:hypothetical protein
MNVIHTYDMYFFSCINIKSCCYVLWTIINCCVEKLVYVCHTSSLTHGCHGLKYVNTLMNLYLCTFVDAWLGWSMYLSMIDENYILIELGFNWFNATCDFNTIACSSKKEVLMNWNVQNQRCNSKEKKSLQKAK